MSTKNYHFHGSFTEHLLDGSEKKLHGVYYVTEKKTRFLVTFKPFGYQFPILIDFCILKKKSKNMLGFYISEIWN